MDKPDVIVVGAGIAGLLTARELRRSGFSVTVVDRAVPGAGASRAAAGILSPLSPWRTDSATKALVSWSQRHYPALAAEIARESGIDPEYTPSGMLVFGETASEALAWAAGQGRAAEMLSPAETAACEPVLAENPREAIFLPQVAHVNTSRLTRALAQAVVSAGVSLRDGVKVTGLAVDDGRVSGILINSEKLAAPRVVLAAGAWSSQLTAPLGLALRTRPVRGQILQLDAPDGLLSRILLEKTRYIVPRSKGRLIVGSTVEEAGFDASTDDATAAELHAFAASLSPALGRLPIKHRWAGLRPATPDGLPYIGPHPDVPGLYLNTGHYRHGITTAPASARLLADLIAGREPVIDPRPYRPER